MRTVVGMYDRFENAQQVVRDLRDSGYPSENISLISNDSKGEYSRYLSENQEGVESSGGEGAAAGAGIGAVLGGLGGLLLGLGALAIPGIGPVIAAGPIVAALAGAGIGAVTGGLVGALVDMGIPEEHANLYSEGVRRGGTLVVVRTHEDMSNQAVDIMNRYGPVDINERSTTWQSDQSDHDTLMSHDTDRTYDRSSTHDIDYDRVRDDNTAVPVTGDRIDDMTIRDTVRSSDMNIERMDTHDMGHRDWNSYDQTFRQDFQTRYGTGQYGYDYYMPAYRYGYDLAGDERYSSSDWSQVEYQARQDWERRGNQSTWEDVKDAVRHAWDSVRRRV